MPAQESPSPAAPKFTDQVQDFIKEQSPELKKQIDTLNALRSHPVVKVGTELVQDSEFSSALSQMAGGNRAAQFLAYEAILLVAVWIVRAWRLSKSNTLLPRLWTQAWIGAVYWAAALTVVPWLVWGDSFRTVLSHLLRSVLRHVLT